MASPGRRRHHCRDCREVSEQERWHRELRPDGKVIERWQCVACSLELLHLGGAGSLRDVLDVVGLCESTARSAVRRGSLRPGLFEDAASYLQAEVWSAFCRWDPSKCRDFLAFATTAANQRLIDFRRHEEGRDGRTKAHSHAVSLSARIRGGRDEGDERVLEDVLAAPAVDEDARLDDRAALGVEIDGTGLLLAVHESFTMVELANGLGMPAGRVQRLIRGARAAAGAFRDGEGGEAAA